MAKSFLSLFTLAEAKEAQVVQFRMYQWRGERGE